ncbi:hypothetical protein GOY14_00340 [Wolbachia endosymbiont of Dipetalonema caudispina]|uniref:hypothetical protein n=1 Tax=Wolbachia endosymbiont of Dipetalonema caudispina TaxID=1812112 RepID=UPI00158D2D12|nr:hypothetical protein [Wolbachia endosymbiont of Dipetalonema caudispina]QKX00820.1 hypothetical protein GOY14_00340 [Wolbachia endosymbiont of Dipetalonema caudispina]
MLPKGSLNNWRLIKTKIIIFQPLIIILASSVLSFTAGQYFPYITAAAISGSGITTTVAPLMIFISSVATVLILMTYFTRLCILKIGDKQEVSFNEEVLNKEQRIEKVIKKSVLDNGSMEISFNKTIDKQDNETEIEINGDINLEDELNTCASTQLSLIPDKSIPQANAERLVHSSSSALLSSLAPSSSMVSFPKRVNSSSNISEGKVSDDVNQRNSKDILLEQIKKGVKLRNAKNTNVQQKQFGTTNQNQDMVLILNIALAQRRTAIKSSDSESNCSSSNSSSYWSTDEERIKKKRLIKHKEKSVSQALSPSSEQRNNTLKSGYRSDDGSSELTSLLHSAPTQEVKKPSILPKPANLQARSKIFFVKEENNADLVGSNIKDPSVLSFKERINRFGN